LIEIIQFFIDLDRI